MSVGKIDTAGHWMVDTSHIYIPSDVSYPHENLTGSDTGRVESGGMHITWIRRDLRKIELTYNYLTGAEKDTMVNLMQGKEFDFTYYDNGVKTIRGYCGKCSYQSYSHALFATEGGLYKNFKINVEEM